jgi:hypothetical protein
MLDSWFLLFAALAGAAQAPPIAGTWTLARIFRSGPAPATRTVPLDSTVYVRMTVEAHAGGWLSGRLDRRYYGRPERSKIEGGPLGNTGRYILGVDLEWPASQRARTAAWFVGDTLRLGTPLVPDADSIEFRRVAPDAPDPAAVLEVVTP